MNRRQFLASLVGAVLTPVAIALTGKPELTPGKVTRVIYDAPDALRYGGEFAGYDWDMSCTELRCYCSVNGAEETLWQTSFKGRPT